MPFENEHAARLKSPGGFVRIRRGVDRGGPGIDFLFGVRKDGKSEIQAIRFDRKKFTTAEARKWLADHDFKPIEFEKATGGDDMSESTIREEMAPRNRRGLDARQTFEAVQRQGRKFSQREVNFQNRSTSVNTVCGTCRFYLRDPTSLIGACQVVDGAIPWFGTSALYISAAAEAIATFAAEAASSTEQESTNVQEADGIPVPASGTCPASYPNKRRGSNGEMRCFLADTPTREAVEKLDFSNFFEVLNGQAKHLGEDQPADLEPLDGPPAYALVQEDQERNQNRAEVIRDIDAARSEVMAREVIERQQEAGLLVVVGRAVGKLDNRTIFQDQFGFRWSKEQEVAVQEDGPASNPVVSDLPVWKASFNLAGATLDLDLWPMEKAESRTLGRQLSEANHGVEVEFRAQLINKPIAVTYSWSRSEEREISESRERLRGAHIAKRFRNLRGLVGNLGEEEEGRMQPFNGNRQVYAIAIETPESQPSRLLRIGEVEVAEAERLTRNVAEANSSFRIVLAKVVGMLDGQEVFEAVAQVKPQEEPTGAPEPAPTSSGTPQ